MKNPYEAPIYPQLSFEADKRRKLTQEDIAEMKEWRERGRSYQWIADTFGVSRGTATYHLDPEFREKRNKHRYELLKKSYEDDPDKLKAKSRDWNERWAERVKTDETAAEFKAKHTYKWKKKRYHTDEEFRKKTLEQAKDHYKRVTLRAKGEKSL